MVPFCPKGQVAEIVNNCYGQCVDAETCDEDDQIIVKEDLRTEDSTVSDLYYSQKSADAYDLDEMLSELSDNIEEDLALDNSGIDNL